MSIMRATQIHWRLFIVMVFLGITSLGAFPQGCEEQGKILEQFKYITERQDYRPPVEGEVTVYQTNGPVIGGSVQALAIGPDGAVYAGFFGDGVYKSTDGGRQWKPAKAGLGDSFIIALMVHTNGTVYAGTVRRGVFRSEDGGKSWIESNEGLTNSQVPSLAFDRHQTLYAGTGAGVFVSRDGGRHWKAANEGLKIALVRSITIHPAGTVYIGTAGNGIYRSHDAGKKWQPVNTGLTDAAGMRENFIRSLTLAKDGALYAGSFGGGVFKTTDDGKTWISVSTGLTNDSIRGLVIGQDGRLFIGTGLGIFTSSDGGDHWTTVSEAMPDTNVQSLVLDPAGNLYVGTGTGILKKDRGSNAWEVLDRGIVFPTVRALTFDPDRGIFAGTHGSGIHRSRDAGNIWEPMSEGLPNADVRILVQDSQRTLYAGTDRGVYVGDRKIRQWVHLGEGMGPLEIKALAMTKEDTLYAGTSQGLYRRSPGQDSWKTVDLPLSDLNTSSKDTQLGTIQSVVIGQGSELYAATEDQLFSQAGKDKAWQSILKEPIPGKIRGMAADETIYVWTETAIFRGEKSREGPFRWKNISQAMPPGLIIYTVIMEQGGQGNVMYAGTHRGLFWTRDEGKHWQSAQGSSAGHPVEAIFTAGQGILLLGSQEQGVLFAVHLSQKGIFDRFMGK